MEYYNAAPLYVLNMVKGGSVILLPTRWKPLIPRGSS